jgi:rhodanese-related sulfurtransferase
VRAGELLAKHGYKVVGACGIQDWKQKQKPVVYPKK